MPPSNSVDNARRFLGMITYYSTFIPNAASVTITIRRFLQKIIAFEKIKKEIVIDRVLKPFCPDLPVQII